MWWQYVIVAVAFIASVLFIGFRLKNNIAEPGCGGECGGCSVGNCSPERKVENPENK